MMTKTDFDNIVLSKHEFDILKQLRKGKSLSLSSEERKALYLTGLVKQDTSGVDEFRSPIPTGTFSISDDGRRYLINHVRNRADRWAKPIIIPVIVSVITTIITSELFPVIKPLMSDLLESILKLLIES